MHHHYIDQYAQGRSPIHRLDARAKVLAVLAYSAVLISFGRYEVAALAPLAVLPLAMLWLSGVPVTFALKRAAMLSPLILTLCLLSPWYDRLPQAAAVGPWRFSLAGGWLTAGSVAVKFTLGMAALTALMCTTPFSLLLEALRRLGVPRLLVAQLGFLYRYIFVLIDQAQRVRRARDFRGAALAPAGRRLSAVGGIIGALFVRTLERSERVHLAMRARGYDTQTRSMDRLHWHAADVAALAAAAAYLAVCRVLLPLIARGNG